MNYVGNGGYMTALCGSGLKTNRLDVTLANPDNVFAELRVYTKSGSDATALLTLHQAREVRTWLDQMIRNYELSRVDEI